MSKKSKTSNSLKFKDKFVIKKEKQTYTLKELISKINKNVHKEICFGKPSGKELL